MVCAGPIGAVVAKYVLGQQCAHRVTSTATPHGAAEEYRSLSAASILVIDDEPGMRNFLTKILQPRARRVEQAASAQEATQKLDAAHFDLVILDNLMPGERGLDWVANQRKRGFYADTILITAYADLETAITALRAGVSDFVLKPFRANQILGAVERALDRKNLRRDNALLRRELSADYGRGQLLGASAALRHRSASMDTLISLGSGVAWGWSLVAMLFLGAGEIGMTMHIATERK